MSIGLDVKNLCVRRGGELVLEDVTFSLPLHQVTGLTGPNGGGKTTLFEVLAGACPSVSGEIHWPQPLEISYLQQQLLPKKLLPITVEDFVRMGTWGPAKKTTAALDYKTAIDVMSLSSFSKNLLSDLSGGQWQRALLARCLVQPADLYLLDEPFNHLDIEMESRLGELLQKLSQNQQKTFFVISHDWHAMDHYFGGLLLLNRRVIARGPVREVNDFYTNWRNPDHHKRIHHS